MLRPARDALKASRAGFFIIAFAPPQNPNPRLQFRHQRRGGRIAGMNVGTEWLIDATGCDTAALTRLSTLREVCDTIVGGLALCVVGEPQWHVFPDPGGVTGLYLLTESHLACHTYPEHGLATFNLYCCRPRGDWDWRELLAERLQATQVTVRRFARGTVPAANLVARAAT